MMTDISKDAPMLEGLMDMKSLAQRFSVSKRSIQRRLTENKLPKPIRIGRLLRWIPQEVEKWIADKCPDLSRIQKVRGA